jgi:hypothetical protein
MNSNKYLWDEEKKMYNNKPKRVKKESREI